MQSLIAALPPEVARRIHPDWQKNEAEYWAHRDELLPQYRDQWIGFANGRVIVAGSSPVEVFHKAQESGEHPFVTCVGHEAEPNRMRRASFSYDTTYPGEPLPVMTLEFRKDTGSPGAVFDQQKGIRVKSLTLHFERVRFVFETGREPMSSVSDHSFFSQTKIGGRPLAIRP